MLCSQSTHNDQEYAFIPVSTLPNPIPFPPFLTSSPASEVVVERLPNQRRASERESPKGLSATTETTSLVRTSSLPIFPVSHICPTNMERESMSSFQRDQTSHLMMDYNPERLPPQISAWLNTNTSTSPGDDLDLFFHCWIRSSCPSCLSPSNPYPCSWCETSQACVPNTIFSYPFGILSPIKSEDICPLRWRERWEMRARPFSCRCSSMTFVSVVVAVAATLLGVLLIWLSVVFGRWVGRKWRARKPGWWRAENWRPTWMKRRGKDASTETEPERQTLAGDSETTPLLA